MNCKPTIANIETFMSCRAVETFKRGYKYGDQFGMDKYVLDLMQRGMWESTQFIYDVKRR